jgi:hypothetical protein
VGNTLGVVCVEDDREEQEAHVPTVFTNESAVNRSARMSAVEG